MQLNIVYPQTKRATPPRDRPFKFLFDPTTISPALTTRRNDTCGCQGGKILVLVKLTEPQLVAH